MKFGSNHLGSQGKKRNKLCCAYLIIALNEIQNFFEKYIVDHIVKIAQGIYCLDPYIKDHWWHYTMDNLFKKQFMKYINFLILVFSSTS